MNDNQDVPNPELREHVSDHSFVLSLRKSHIAMLIATATQNFEAFYALRMGVSAAHGLKRRGLLLHHTDVYGREQIRYFGSKKVHRYTDSSKPFSAIYRLTRAGWAVYDLLVEAGLTVQIPHLQRKVA